LLVVVVDPRTTRRERSIAIPMLGAVQRSRSRILELA
jgi:hypothetical protein